MVAYRFCPLLDAWDPLKLPAVVFEDPFVVQLVVGDAHVRGEVGFVLRKDDAGGG